MRKFLVLFALLITQLGSYAQILEPVKWSFHTEEKGDEVILNFKAVIDSHWHLYDVNLPEGGPISTSFNFEDEKGFEKIGEMKSNPAPIDTFDPTFEMNLRYFEKEVTFSQRIKVKDANIKNIKGYVEFMACDDETCLPPTEVDFTFKVTAPKNAKNEPAKATNTKNTDAASVKEEPTAAKANESTTSANNDKTEDATVSLTKIEEAKQTTTGKDSDKEEKDSSSLWFFFWGSFVAGLLAILTPCVFPMIPMTVSFFMNSGESKAKGRFLAIFYGLCIVAIYTIIGTIVAIIFGPDIANWLSTHWIPNLIFFAVFVFFAFSFFGMFEITLPSWVVNKTDANSDKGGLAGAFFMALTLVLVSFSCTGPIVGSVLIESAGGQVVKPIIGMLGFSLAFALPFALFALFPSWLSNLPKSGGWLNTVKVVLGFLELALGLKFLSVADQTYHWGILDREVYLALWIVIFTLMGLYLLGKLKFAHDSDVKTISVPRLMLSIASFSFAVYMVPGMFGAPLKAISGYMPPMTTHDFNIKEMIRNEIKISGGVSANNDFSDIKIKYSELGLKLPHGLDGFFDYEQGMAYAKEKGKPVFIDFTGHGCVNCREMEANVWGDPRVLDRLRNDYVIIAIYVDDKTLLPEEEWITSKRDGKVKKTLGKKNTDFQIEKFGANAQPYYVLLDNEGRKLTEPKAYDLNPDNFVHFLDEGLAAYKK